MIRIFTSGYDVMNSLCICELFSFLLDSCLNILPGDIDGMYSTCMYIHKCCMNRVL